MLEPGDVEHRHDSFIGQLQVTQQPLALMFCLPQSHLGLFNVSASLLHFELELLLFIASTVQFRGIGYIKYMLSYVESLVHLPF